MPRLRARGLVAAAGLMAVSLLFPWFYGTDDGQPLTIAGWDTEPGFTLGMVACACLLAIAGAVDRPLLAVPPSTAALTLTSWMLLRGERYSGYERGPGGFIAIFVSILALALVAARSRPRRPQVEDP
jgi:hypothetical protein